MFDLPCWGKAVAIAVGFGVVLSTQVALAQDWTMGGQNLQNSRNQPFTWINPNNAASLKKKWVFTTGGSVSATPAVANGVVYFPDLGGNFYAVNAQTGLALWSHKLTDWTGVAGDYSRTDPAVYGNVVILGDQGGNLGSGARVMAVNATTGNAIWVSQVESFPLAFVTSSPVVFNGVVYVGIASIEEGAAANPAYPCCSSHGSVVALDVWTGRVLWQTYTVSSALVAEGYSGGSVWGSTPAIDPLRNSIYVGTGNNFSVPAAVKACILATPGNKACTDPADYFDSILALDLTTGAIKWADRAMSYDTWNVACLYGPAGSGNCPNPEGPDYDFGGSGPNLISGGAPWGRDILGIGEKSGTYWAVNPNNGSLIWHTQVGPGSALGGIEWGTATDGYQIYVPITRGYAPLGIPNITYKLQPSGEVVNGGSWSALNPATGKIVWQTGTPGTCSVAAAGVTQGCAALSPPSVANGVVFVGSMDTTATNPTMFALDARSGSILWSFAAGSSVIAAPAIVGDSIYWGSGYGNLGIGTPNTQLFALSINDDAQQ